MNDFLHAFPGQEAYEPVYVFARPYALAFLPTALIFLIIIVASLLGQLGIVNGVFGSLSADEVNSGFLILGAFQLFALTIFLSAILDFYYDIVIVTDRRVVTIDQEMLFYRKISELSLEDVEDVTSVVEGFLPTLFEYGQVQIQTAAARDEFNMDNVRFPREITAIVQNLADQARKEIPVDQRIPQTAILAVIDSRRLSSTAQLNTVGAMLPDDFRLVPRTNVPQPVPVQPSA